MYMHPFAALFLALCICAMPDLAFAQSSRILIILGHNTQVDIDGERVGTAIAGEPKSFTVFPGEHLLGLRSVDGKYQWSGKIVVAPGLQQIFDRPLIPIDPMMPFLEREVDSRDGHSYRVVTVNRQTWLGENLRIALGKNFLDSSGERLYDRASAKGIAVLPGWHLPKQEEWESLLAAYGSDSRNALLNGGASQINLRDSAIYYAPVGRSQTWEVPPGQGIACYWMDLGGDYVPAVILRPNKIEIGGNFPVYSLCAVRLVRNK